MEPKPGACWASKWNGDEPLGQVTVPRPPRHVTVQVVGLGPDGVKAMVGFLRCGSYTPGIVTMIAFLDDWQPCTEEAHDHER